MERQGAGRRFAVSAGLSVAAFVIFGVVTAEVGIGALNRSAKLVQLGLLLVGAVCCLDALNVVRFFEVSAEGVA